MKNLGGKFNVEKIGQLALAHFEKVVLSGIALFVVYLLIYQPLMTESTKWKSFGRTVDDFEGSVNRAQQAHSTSRWTAEQKKEFEVADITLTVSAGSPSASDKRYEFSTPFHFSPNERKQKDRVPVLLPVVSLLADASRAILSPADAEEEEELAEADDGKVKGRVVGDNSPMARTSTVAPRKDRSKGSFKGGGGGGFGGGGTPMGNLGGGGTPMGNFGGGTPMGNFGGGGGASMDPSSAQIGGGGMQNPSSGFNGGGQSVYNSRQRVGTPQGYNFVAVRGLMMLREQAEQFRKALGLETLNEALAQLEILDFELQRQLAVAGDDPWRGEWRPVNLQPAADIVQSVTWDVDVVSSDLTDQVFTMPLPLRDAGDWDWHGTHPNLGILAAEQREQQVLENQAAIKKVQGEDAKKKKRKRKGGFAGLQHDIRGIRGNVLQGEEGSKISKSATKKMSAEGYQSFTGGYGRGRSGGNQFQLSLSGKVLLFRFLDFDVIPGNAYRYRVRLILRNPNYEKPPFMLHATAVASAEKETLATPWSIASGLWDGRRRTVVPGSAIVRKNVRYFLDAVQPERRRSPKTAKFNIFQWYSAAGTDINGSVRAQLGEFIADVQKALVLRPAIQSFEEEEGVRFQTGDVLLDVKAPAPLEAADHPELSKALGQLRGSKSMQLASSAALVVDRYGQMVAYGHGFDDQVRLQREQQQMEFDRRPWRQLREKKQTQPGQGFSISDDQEGKTSKKGKKKRGRRGKKNPIRRNNSYGGGGMPGMGGGMGGGMPGMGGGMGGAMPGGIPGMGGGGPMGGGGGFPGGAGNPMGGGGGFPGNM